MKDIARIHRNRPTHMLAVLIVLGMNTPAVSDDKEAERAPSVVRNQWEAVTISSPEGGSPAQVHSLNFASAIERVLAYAPELKAAYIEIDARKNDALQASVRANPELLIQLENFAGNKAARGFGIAEETLQITQLFEFGDKRLKRLRVANFDTALAGWEYEVARMRAITNGASLFVDVLASQERIGVLQKAVSVSEKIEKAVETRVKSGGTSPVETDRAKVNSARARAALKGEKERHKAAKIRLATSWGANSLDFDHVTGTLNNGGRVPSLDRVEAYIAGNPLVTRWSDEIGRRSAMLDVELAKRIPDFRIGAGVRRLEEFDSTAIVASVSVPLQIFDRNTGNIAAAETRLAKAEQEERAARTSVTGSVAETLGELAVAAAQVRSLKDEVLPAAEAAYEKTQQGYEQARFDLLSVLDAQRTLFEVRLELVTAKAEFEKARVRAEALLGRSISNM